MKKIFKGIEILLVFLGIVCFIVNYIQLEQLKFVYATGFFIVYAFLVLLNSSLLDFKFTNFDNYVIAARCLFAIICLIILGVSTLFNLQTVSSLNFISKFLLALVGTFLTYNLNKLLEEAEKRYLKFRFDQQP